VAWARRRADRPALTSEQVRAALLSFQPGSEAEDDPAGRRVPRDETETLAVELPGGDLRPAAVLCAVFDQAGEAHVLLTRRAEHLRSHTGQVAFPGGRVEPGEQFEAAARREAWEEVGLDPESVEIIAALSVLTTTLSPAPVIPFVALLEGPPELRPNPAEVARVFSVPLSELASPEVVRLELWPQSDGSERPMLFFELAEETVWGATARILGELLEAVLAAP
jgi:8-oxo-dGTP pyrophosphatase MutT (NUDIX family)